ncbi:MAG: endolytic transglycosylase MltG [Anaerolineales bacterium]
MHTRDAIKQRRRRANLAVIRLFILTLAVIVVAAVSVIVLARAGAATQDVGPAAEDLNPAERLVLLAYLSAHAADLATPAGADPTPITFTIHSGESAAAIAERLATLSLVREARLLDFYLRYKGLDQHIEAGDFILRQTMTIPEIAAALADASAHEVSVRVVEGWRLEQIAEALSADPNLAVSQEEFLALAGRGGQRPGNYPFLGDLPAGVSLEGFLFPDTYLVHPGATASDVIDKMLANFDARLPAGYRSAVAERGLTLYQAITIASLIEREAALAEERPLIASVILNRLVIGQPLQIDATLQYALGAPGDWWPSVAGLDFSAIASPYNTYTLAGLPAGPIANPGLDSILAVAHPSETKYLYYRAQCDGSGRHSFAVTYEEHLANACP